MKTGLLLVCLLVFVPVWPCRTAETVAVGGRVIDPQGRPVVGARVQAVLIRWTGIREVKTVSEALSEEDCLFNFSALERPCPKDRSSQYYFVAHLRGKNLGWVAGEGRLTAYAYHRNPEPQYGYTIIAAKPETRKVRVVDRKGAGIAGVVVDILSIRTQNSNPYADSHAGADIILQAIDLKPTVTDGDGFVRLRHIPEGASVSLSLEKPPYIDRDYHDAGPKLVVEEGGAIAGRVVNDKGEPVTSVEVHGWAKAVTNEDGAYLLKGVPPQRVDVWCEVVGKIARPVEGVAVKAGKTTVVRTIVLRSGVPVTGRVYEVRTNNPIENIVVEATNVTTTKIKWRSRSEPTGRDGSYTVAVLPGQVGLSFNFGQTVHHESPRRNLWGFSIDVPAAGLAGLDQWFEPVDYIRGRVRDESGKPVPDATVQVLSEQAEWPRSVLTNHQGIFVSPLSAYRFKNNLPPIDRIDDEKVTVSARDMVWKQGRYVVFSWPEIAQRDVVIDLASARTLKVTVTDLLGVPLPGVKLQLERANDRRLDKCSTDSNGQAVFKYFFPGGRYYLGYPQLPGYFFRKAGVRLPDPESHDWKDELRLVMERGTRSLSGRAVDEAGKPVAGASVAASHFSTVISSTFANAKGEFVLDGLPNLPITVFVHSADADGTARDVTENTELVVILKKRQ